MTITCATKGAVIHYTTDGTTPTVNSAVYSQPITVNSSETISAIASLPYDFLSATSSATYTSTADTATPVFSLPSGIYSGAQTLSIADTSSGANIYYTVDGTTPTTSSNLYSQPITVSASETVRAMATAPGLLASALVSAAYDIEPLYTFNFSQGFSQAQASGQIQFNGSTDLDDFRLQLTNGGLDEAGSAFYTRPVNIQAFTTDFTFQLSNPMADGITFTIQNAGPTALGAYGGGLGYAAIPRSLAIKFDLYNNAGEGPDSTGLYLNGAEPTVPAIDLTNTGIGLHSGDYIDAHLTYDGVNLNLTLTDAVTLATWSYSFPINIPSIVGGNAAYVGFTGGTGSKSSSQKVTSWTYLAGPPLLPNFPVGFDSARLSLNGAAVSGTSLQLTSGVGTKPAAPITRFPSTLRPSLPISTSNLPKLRPTGSPS